MYSSVVPIFSLSSWDYKYMYLQNGFSVNPCSDLNYQARPGLRDRGSVSLGCSQFEDCTLNSTIITYLPPMLPYLLSVSAFNSDISNALPQRLNS